MLVKQLRPKESLLHRKESQIGEVHDGAEQWTGWNKNKKEELRSLQIATTCFWRDHRINIIDTPGRRFYY